MIPFALLLLLFGAVYSLVGSVQLLIVMFRESVWWGLAQFLVPLANLPFMCFHFKEAWPPTKKCLAGLACVVAAGFLLPLGDMAEQMKSNVGLLNELLNAESFAPARPSTPFADRETLAFRTVGDYRGKTLIQGEGEVLRLLADDRDGSKHQRFIVRFASGQTLLVAHNIDVGRRVEGLKVGDRIAFYGEYAKNAEGGVVHWTHRDLKGRHPDGWLRLRGVTYQ